MIYEFSYYDSGTCNESKRPSASCKSVAATLLVCSCKCMGAIKHRCRCQERSVDYICRGDNATVHWTPGEGWSTFTPAFSVGYI